MDYLDLFDKIPDLKLFKLRIMVRAGDGCEGIDDDLSSILIECDDSMPTFLLSVMEGTDRHLPMIRKNTLSECLIATIPLLVNRTVTTCNEMIIGGSKQPPTPTRGSQIKSSYCEYLPGTVIYTMRGKYDEAIEVTELFEWLLVCIKDWGKRFKNKQKSLEILSKLDEMAHDMQL